MRKQTKAKRQKSQERQRKQAAKGRSPKSSSGAPALFMRQKPEASPSRAALEDRYALDVLESVDGFAGLRNGLRRIANKTGEWAGIPMPIENQPMTIEPTYPRYAELMEIGRKPEETTEPDVKIRNRFWSFKWRAEIIVWEEEGKILWGPHQPYSQVDLMLSTLGCADAWGIEQERNAVNTLGSLLRHRQFKQYLLTGMFMERSKRSGLSYLFRRLRPTVVISHAEERLRILCALCLHPIGYYEGSWAGAMTPTDDVVAHLMLMRGDEAMFWRRSNQHAPHRREAGVS